LYIYIYIENKLSVDVLLNKNKKATLQKLLLE